LKTTAFDFVEMLRRMDYVRTSQHLSHVDKRAIFQDMHRDLPPDQFCHTSLQTLEIVKRILIDGSTQKATRKVGEKAKKPKHGATSEHLFPGLDENGRGSSTKEKVVNKAP
jgi:hypothetical protein